MGGRLRDDLETQRAKHAIGFATAVERANGHVCGDAEDLLGRITLALVDENVLLCAIGEPVVLGRVQVEFPRRANHLLARDRDAPQGRGVCPHT